MKNGPNRYIVGMNDIVRSNLDEDHFYVHPQFLTLMIYDSAIMAIEITIKNLENKKIYRQKVNYEPKNTSNKRNLINAIKIACKNILKEIYIF